MKKILILMLALVMVLSVFSSCTITEQEEDTTEAPETLTIEQALKNAIAFVKDKYKSYLTANETAADFDLVSSVQVSGVDYAITWTVDNAAVKVVAGEGKVTIDVDEKSAEEVSYTLTAVVTAADGTQSEPLEFKLKVPAYKVLSYESYYAAEKDTAVVVEGIVIAVHSQEDGNKYNQLYVMDASNVGGYYVYSMKNDPVKDLGIKAGMTVSVTGTKDIYNGLHEIKDATVTILDTTEKEVTPVDITEAFAAAADLKDENLVNKLAMLVTIKGVEITDQDLSEKSQYLNFKLGDLTSYIRVYRTDLPVSAGGNDGLASILAGHTEHKGWKADVTGVVIVYSGAIYLNPVSVDCFNYIEKIERTPDQMIDIEIGAIEIPEKVLKDTVLELPVVGQTYSDVTISWVSDNACAAVDGGKITVTPTNQEETVTLTATFTLGEVTKTQTYTFTVDKKSPLVATTAPEADVAYKGYLLQVTNNAKIYLDGGVSGRYLSTTKDPSAAVDVFAEKSGEGYKFYIMVEGAKKYIEIYNNEESKVSVQYSDNGSVFTYVAETNIWATAFGEDNYYIGTYNNFETISASKTSYITKDNTGVSQFPLEFVTISCSHSYSGDCDTVCNDCGAARTVETDHTWDNACDADCNVCGETREPADHVDADSDEKCDVCGATTKLPELSIEDALKYTEADPDKVNYLVTGTIEELTNTKYGNVWINDGKGNKILVYGLNDKEGNKYEAMAVKPVVGDTITILCTVGYYGSAPQLAGAVVVDHKAHTHAYTTLANKCDVCAAITEHTCKDDNTDDKCDLCGESLVIPEYTCAEANALEKDTMATVKATVTSIDGKTVIITDATGSFQLYNPTNLADLGLGDKITVTGKIGEYNKTKQISGATPVIDEDHSVVGCKYPETGLTAICTVCGVVKEHTCADADTDTKCDACGEAMPVAGEVEVKYDFSKYAAGDQYAEETHKLDEVLTLKIKDCHLQGTDLRIYSSNEHNGVAIFESTKVITKVAFNAGNKADTLNVYGSTNGTDWTLIEGVAVVAAYTDYSVSIANSTYTYIKLDVAGTNQIRLKSLTLTYVDGGASAPSTPTIPTDAVELTPGMGKTPVNVELEVGTKTYFVKLSAETPMGRFALVGPGVSNPTWAGEWKMSVEFISGSATQFMDASYADVEGGTTNLSLSATNTQYVLMLGSIEITTETIIAFTVTVTGEPVAEAPAGPTCTAGATELQISPMGNVANIEFDPMGSLTNPGTYKFWIKLDAGASAKVIVNNYVAGEGADDTPWTLTIDIDEDATVTSITDYDGGDPVQQGTPGAFNYDNYQYTINLTNAGTTAVGVTITLTVTATSAT